MDTFTASNGSKFVLDDAGDLRIYRPAGGYVYMEHRNVEALRQFFQAEEDECLGRWRWPENPDITVRIAPKHAQRTGSDVGTVMIQQDSDGYVGYYERDSLLEITNKTGGIIRAGHAYFDAHPEPKPWHEAKPGEVWLVTFSDGGGGSTMPWTVRHSTNRFWNRDIVNEVDPADSTIVYARRIWPEESA